MRKLSILLIVIMTLCLLVACSSETKQSTEKTKEDSATKYSLQGTTQGRYLTGGVPPVRFSM